MTISKPTKEQIEHGLDRVIVVFVVAVGGYLQSHTSFDKSTVHAAILAGYTAVIQLIISTLTTH